MRHPDKEQAAANRPPVDCVCCGKRGVVDYFFIDIWGRAECRGCYEAHGKWDAREHGRGRLVVSVVRPQRKERA